MSDILFSPVLLSLGASFLFGVMVIFAKLALRHLEPFTAARRTIGVTVLFFWALLPLFFRLEELVWPGILVFAVVGLFQPVLSMAFSFEATRSLGPTVSATVSSISPIFAMGGAALLLGEVVTLPIFLGTLGVVGGVIVLSWQGAVRREWALSALLFPLATAAIRGFGNLGTRYGIELLPNVVLAGAVAYTVSFLMAQLLRKFKPAARPQPFTMASLWPVVAAGIGNGLAMLLLILALKHGQVVVVIPIVSSSPLVTLLFSLLWLPQEALSPRMLVAMLLIMPSIAMIGLAS
ncbi:MAG: DMT family transporter [SAR324 cluster bacterium]|nr:DMT family transporter [SAR324 cluster bacterium]